MTFLNALSGNYERSFDNFLKTVTNDDVIAFYEWAWYQAHVQGTQHHQKQLYPL